jgi:hypothetical protein
MAEPFLMTGTWIGHYTQHGRSHPITAELTQVGTRLTGTMHDSDTESERSVFETAAEAGLPPGADEEIVLGLRKMFVDAPQAPVRCAALLPAESRLEGEVRDRTVSFLKTYQGEHFTGFRVGDRYVGAVIEGHQVHYRGELSRDGTSIEGRWWIAPPTEGGVRTEGGFLLRRETTTGSAGKA